MARTMKKKSAPESAAEWVPLSRLKVWEDNPRKNDGRPVDVAAASIKEFGFGAPIVARLADGEIIAGHTRFKAAQKLGLESVPVRFLDLDEKQAHALALVDNRAAELAMWDSAGLLKQLESYDGGDLLVASLGFDSGYVSKLLAQVEHRVVENVDPTKEWEGTGMPPYEHDDEQGFRRLIVHFKDQAAVDEFSKLVGCVLSEKTKFIWLPDEGNTKFMHMKYVNEPISPAPE